MRTRACLWLTGILALGALLRALYLLTPALDSDAAVVGLMGRHILQGEFPIFYWGQPFAGTLEAHVAAVLFFLFGPSRLTLALSPFLFSLSFLALTYRLAREAFDREVGLLACLLAALPAPFFATHSISALANYIENLVLGSLVLLLAIRLPERPGVARRRALVLLGFVAGLAWYESPQSIHYLATCGIFLLLRAPGLPLQREFWVLPPAFLVGSLPLWLYNLRSGSTFRAIYAQASGRETARSLGRYVGWKLPYALGVTTGGEALTVSVPLLVLAVYALALLYLLYRWRLPGSRLCLLLLFATSSVVVLGYNRGGTMRYLLPLYSALPIMLAAFLVALRRFSVPLFALALVAVLATNLAGNVATIGVFHPRAWERYRQDLASDARLFDFLKADGLTRVYVLDFWEAYRLTFDAQERIVFAEPHPILEPTYTRLVDASERYGYVARGRLATRAIEESLRSIGGDHRKREAGGYAVFDAFVPPAEAPLRALSRGGWRATASNDAAETGRAFDRNSGTSWSTGIPQRRGAYYQLDLGAVRPIGTVTLVPGPSEPVHDRAYRVERSTDGARWETMLAGRSSWLGLEWVDSRLRVDPGGRVHIRVAPTPARWLRITLLSENQSVEWSIAELYVSELASGTATAVASPGVAALRAGIRRAGDGNWPEAARLFQEAADRDPDWEAPHAQLSAAYERLGIDGRGSYERALALERRGLAELAAWEYWQAVQSLPHSNHTFPLLRLAGISPGHGGPDHVEPVDRLLAGFVPTERREATFGGRIRLLGFALDRREVEPGGRLHVSYFWKCEREMEKDYGIFALLRGKRTMPVDNHAPLEGLYPTSRWRQGEVVREDREIVIPPATQPGPLSLSVGFWDPSSRRRLRVEGASAPNGDRVELTQLLVTSRPP